MGFPVGYSEILLPKLILQILFFLGFLQRLISSSMDAIGLGSILDSEAAPLPHPPAASSLHQTASAALIQETLPSVRVQDLLSGDRRPISDGCAVCLHEFHPSEEVRLLSNCRHVFHRRCLDRWIERDQETCPLCRTPLVPREMREAIHRRIWAAAGFSDSDFSEDFLQIASCSSSPLLPFSSPLVLPISA